MADGRERERLSGYKADHAKTARSSCSLCRKGIGLHDLRFGAKEYVRRAFVTQMRESFHGWR